MLSRRWKHAGLPLVRFRQRENSTKQHSKAKRMHINDIILEAVRAQNRVNEILVHIRLIGAAILVVLIASKWFP